jgi:hypothetical protein
MLQNTAADHISGETRERLRGGCRKIEREDGRWGEKCGAVAVAHTA